MLSEPFVTSVQAKVFFAVASISAPATATNTSGSVMV